MIANEGFRKFSPRTQSGLGILGDGLGAFRDGVPGELSGKDELDSGLDLPRGESPPLVESDELGALRADAVEGVMNERVHDVHGLLADSDVGVDLLEDLVDVDREGLDTSPPGLLVISLGSFGGGLSAFSGLLSHLNRNDNKRKVRVCLFEAAIIRSIGIINSDWIELKS